MEFRLVHAKGYGKLWIILFGCLIIAMLAVIANFNYLQLQYYIITLSWEKAINVIDRQITTTQNEVYKDQLYIYRIKILGAMSKAADVLSQNSKRLLDDEEEVIHSKYQAIFQKTSKECYQNLVQLKKIAEKRSTFKTMVYLSAVDYMGEYRKLTEKESDEFFRQLVGNYFYLDMSLTRMDEFGLRLKYITGVFTVEGLAESVFYAQAFGFIQKKHE